MAGIWGPVVLGQVLLARGRSGDADALWATARANARATADKESVEGWLAALSGSTM